MVGRFSRPSPSSPSEQPVVEARGLHHQHPNDNYNENSGVGTRSCMPNLPWNPGSAAGVFMKKHRMKAATAMPANKSSRAATSQGSGSSSNAASSSSAGAAADHDHYDSWGFSTTPDSGRRNRNSSPQTIMTQKRSNTTASQQSQPSLQGKHRRRQQQQQQQQSHGKNHVPAHLLTPPAPEDRGLTRRVEYENSQRRRGLYDGEIEPEGVRGQEAGIVAGGRRSQTHHQHQQQQQQFVLGNAGGHRLQPLTIVSPTPNLGANTNTNRLQAVQEESIESPYAEEGSTNNGTGQDDRFLPHHTRQVSERRRLPQHLKHRKQKRRVMDADSTCSDEDIRKMMPDLMPPATTAAGAATTPNILYSQPAAATTSGRTGSSTGSASTGGQVPTAATTPTMRDTEHQIASPEAWHSSDDAAAFQAKAMEYVKVGDYEQALQFFSQALHVLVANCGRSHPATASAYHNLGTVHVKRADLAEGGMEQRRYRATALECFQAAARSARDSLGPNHPNIAVSLVRIGFLLLQSKQYKNAIVTFEEALRIRVIHFGKKHGLVANLFNNLGVCSMHKGDFEKGRDYLQEALVIQRELVDAKERNLSSPKQEQSEMDLNSHQLELADTLFNIGGLCLEWIRRLGPDAERAAEAENAFTEALHVRSSVLGDSHPMVSQVKELLDLARTIPRPRVSKAAPPRSGRVTPSKNRRLASPPGSPLVRFGSATVTPHAQSHPTEDQNVEESMIDPPEVKRSSRNSPEGMNSFSPTASPVGKTNGLFQESRSKESIFRTSSKSASRTKRDKESKNQPPLLQITVSREEDGDNEDEEDYIGQNDVKIYMSPHLLNKSNPQANDESDDALVGMSYEKDDFKVDTSIEGPKSRNHPPLQVSHSYDVEESCLINDSGVDSARGRIHYPFAWNRAGIKTGDDQPQSKRDILVAAPFHSDRRSESRGIGLSKSLSSDRGGVENDVNFTTGNKERDDIMRKAKAILKQHSETNLNVDDGSRGREDGKDVADIKDFEHDPLEDGIAPLGGQWGSSKEKETHLLVSEMLKDPVTHLPEIHDEATKQLQRGNVVDAQRLFEVVLQCQRHRHGPLHSDVADALHNVGITQLRAQNHSEALKAFEESARVRKGSLGKDHPLVAVSLVKVGITLLLLQRFEEALWSFREALSVRKHSLGSLHPSTARIYNNIGCVYVEFNEFREARRAFEAALDIQRSALSQDTESAQLMFGTSTTLCNLGYLYRYRDMHAKAAAVLKEAVDLQEKVLGSAHPTVLSTLDNLADSCANGGSMKDALKYYNILLSRFRIRGTGKDRRKSHRAEAVLLYKMSRVHRQQMDRGAQLECLKVALQSIRRYTTNVQGRTDTLERRIQYDIRACREYLEKEELKKI